MFHWSQPKCGARQFISYVFVQVIRFQFLLCNSSFFLLSDFFFSARFHHCLVCFLFFHIKNNTHHLMWHLT